MELIDFPRLVEGVQKVDLTRTFPLVEAFHSDCTCRTEISQNKMRKCSPFEKKTNVRSWPSIGSLVFYSFVSYKFRKKLPVHIRTILDDLCK